jgi:hypothetical protein
VRGPEILREESFRAHYFFFFLAVFLAFFAFFAFFAMLPSMIPNDELAGNQPCARPAYTTIAKMHLPSGYTQSRSLGSRAERAFLTASNRSEMQMRCGGRSIPRVVDATGGSFCGADRWSFGVYASNADNSARFYRFLRIVDQPIG